MTPFITALYYKQFNLTLIKAFMWMYLKYPTISIYFITYRRSNNAILVRFRKVIVVTIYHNTINVTNTRCYFFNLSKYLAFLSSNSLKFQVRSRCLVFVLKITRFGSRPTKKRTVPFGVKTVNVHIHFFMVLVFIWQFDGTEKFVWRFKNPASQI